MKSETGEEELEIWKRLCLLSGISLSGQNEETR